MDYMIDFEDKKGIISSFSSDEEVVEIPSVLDGISVNVIDAFSIDCDNATKIIFPETVEEISYNNFYDKENLEVVDLSKTKITHLDENVFDSCKNLKTVLLPETLISINNSFKNCKNLEEIVLPDSLQMLTNAFENCKIKSLKVGASLKDMDLGASFDCDKITFSKDNPYYKEDKGFIYYSDTLIMANRKIEEYKIPDDIHKIKTSAFYGANIKTLDLNNVEVVGSFAFKDANIDNLYGNNLSKISSYAFSNLHTKNIELKNLTFIEINAFNGATIGNITLGDKLTTICENAFYEAKIHFFKCPNELLTIEASAFAESTLEKIEFNNKLKSIYERAFANCLKNAMIVLPLTVEYVGPEAFTYSKNATYIFSKNMQYNNSIAFYDKDAVCKNIVVPIKFGNSKDFFADTNLADKEIVTDVSIDMLLKEGLSFKKANEITKYIER